MDILKDISALFIMTTSPWRWRPYDPERTYQ